MAIGMSESAGLRFDIDSSQAQRSTAVLEALKSAAVGVTASSNQLRTANVDLTQSYGQQRDMLARLAEQTKTYDGTLTGLVGRLGELRRGITASTEDFRAYTDMLRTAVATSTQFNSTVAGLDRYVSKARELSMTTADLATGFQRITAALQNQTVAGHDTRVAIEQLGISLTGISSQRPDIVMQRISETLRQYRDTAVKIEIAESVLGAVGPQAIQSLERQPYIPARQREATENQARVSAQIDLTRANVARLQVENERLEARRADLSSRYSQDPTLLGRMGLSFHPIRYFTQSREQEQAELERIAGLPADQRQAYTGLGSQIGDQFRPGHWAGNTLERLTSGTFSANQADIGRQFGEDRQRGFLTAAGLYAGRTLANLPGINAYTAQNQDVRPLAPGEILRQQREAGGILANVGDPALQTRIGLEQRLRQFDTDEIRGRYTQGFGTEEGARRFANQLGAQRRDVRYAGEPAEQTADQTRRQQLLMQVPPEQRARAEAMLRYAESQGVPFEPGMNLGQMTGRLSPNERGIGTQAFNQGIAGQLQGQSEDTRRQIDFQKDLRVALDSGRAAAENFTRAWQTYTQALLSGATEEQANAQAIEATNLALAQRTTQSHALVTAMEAETAAGKKKLDQARIFIADPIARRVLALGEGIEADRARLVREGQLVDPAGGMFRGANVPAPEAQAANDRYVAGRRNELGVDAGRDAVAIRDATRDRLADAQRLTTIMTEQNIGIERAAQLLQNEVQTRELLAKAAAAVNEAEKQRTIELLRQTAEMQRQAQIADATSRNLASARSTNLNSDEEARIQTLPLNEREAARRAAAARIRAREAGAGGGGAFTPTNLPAGISLDEDAAARTIYGEANGQGARGEAAVAAVINNRARGGGGSARDVVFARNQFEPWNGGAARSRMENLDPGSPEYQRALEAYRGIVSGQLTDPTGGATHFYSPAGQAAARDGRTLTPAWTRGQTPVVIGGHHFYRPEGAQLVAPPFNPEQRGVPEVETAEERAVRLGRTGESQVRTGEFQSGQATEARRRELIRQGRAGEAQRLGVVNPSADADLEATRLREHEITQREQQRTGQVGVSQATTQLTKDLNEQTAALKISGAALAEVNRQQQIDREERERGADVVNRQTRSIELQAEALSRLKNIAAQQHQASNDNIESQKAVNAASPFASQSELQAIRERTELEQRFRREPELRGTQVGDQLGKDIEARKALSDQTESVNDMRQAAHGTTSAITGMLDNIIAKGMPAKDALLGLGSALEQIALKTFVLKPLERLMNQLMDELIGGGESGKNGKGSGGGGGGLIDKLLNSTATGGGGNGDGSGTGSTGGGGGGGLIGKAIDWIGRQFSSSSPKSGTNAGSGIEPGGTSSDGFTSDASSENGGGSGGPGGSRNYSTPAGGDSGGSSWNGAIGLIGNLVNKVGGQGFYQNGGLIGSMFGSNSAGTAGGGGGVEGYTAGTTVGADAGTAGGTAGGGDIFGSLLGSGGAGGGSGVSSIASEAAFVAVARGGIFPGRAANSNWNSANSNLPPLSTYENQIVDRPTYFAFARGGAVGQMGEAGHEGILPLKRGSDGRLGVTAHGGGGGNTVNMYVTTPDVNSFGNSRSQLEAKMGAALTHTADRNSFS